MRRFITKQDIDEAADAGRDALDVDDLTTITDLAREHARDRGVRIVETGRGGARAGAVGAAAATAAAPATGSSAGTGGSAAPRAAEVRREVRAAVIARLGHAPEQLDAVIDRVLDQQ